MAVLINRKGLNKSLSLCVRKIQASNDVYRVTSCVWVPKVGLLTHKWICTLHMGWYIMHHSALALVPQRMRMLQYGAELLTPAK